MHSSTGYIVYLLSGKVLDGLFVMNLVSALEQLPRNKASKETGLQSGIPYILHQKKTFVRT